MNNIRILLITILIFHISDTSIYAGNEKSIVISGTKEQPQLLATSTGELSIHLPQLAGVFRLGLISGEKSLWLSGMSNPIAEKSKEKLTFTFLNVLQTPSEIILKICSLPDTNGFIMELECSGLPQDAQFCWAFGAGYGKEVEDKTKQMLLPEYCKDNVFNIEGNAFTLYYGEVMKLRIINGIAPRESEIRLSDTYQINSPLSFYKSGKKTDAPSLCGLFPAKEKEKYYFCLYRRNREVDYNYFMLPELFSKIYK